MLYMTNAQITTTFDSAGNKTRIFNFGTTIVKTVTVHELLYSCPMLVFLPIPVNLESFYRNDSC